MVIIGWQFQPYYDTINYVNIFFTIKIVGMMKIKEKKIGVEEKFELLTPNTQKTIMQFLKIYDGKSSYNQYLTYITNMFYSLGYKDVSQLTFEDYIKSQSYGGDTQKSHRKTFFRYIYAFNKLVNENGFTFNKDEMIKEYGNKLNRKLNKKPKKEKESYVPALDFYQLQYVIDLINMECDITNMDKYKLSFIFYILYNTDYSIEDLKKNINGKNYKDGMVELINGDKFIIPEKYWALMEHLKTYKHSGFASIDDTLKTVGINIGVENLTPFVIRNARTQNTSRCAFCGEKYFNTIENWTAINNQIMCLNCAEVLKKNKRNNEVNINNKTIEVEGIDDNVGLSTFIYTFDELRKKFDNKVDYVKLQKFKETIGSLGERFVYDKEREILHGTKYEDMVDMSPASDHTNGYDIKSYDKKGNERFIEVKTEVGIGNDFYMSENERTIGLEMIKNNKKYIVYRVSNILANDKMDIKYEVIDNIFDVDTYEFKEHVWKINRISKNDK